MSLAKNKKVLFDYEITDRFEAGMKLSGFEVKALKNGRGSLDSAYVIVRGDEVFLTNANIAAYQQANAPKDYDPMRARKLLLHKKEIKKLAEAENHKGLTIVPISVYIKNGKIKTEIGIARGKKKYDKRETIKRRDTERDLRRTLKNTE